MSLAVDRRQPGGRGGDDHRRHPQRFSGIRPGRTAPTTTRRRSAAPAGGCPFPLGAPSPADHRTGHRWQPTAPAAVRPRRPAVPPLPAAAPAPTPLQHRRDPAPYPRPRPFQWYLPVARRTRILSPWLSVRWCVWAREGADRQLRAVDAGPRAGVDLTNQVVRAVAPTQIAAAVMLAAGAIVATAAPGAIGTIRLVGGVIGAVGTIAAGSAGRPLRRRPPGGSLRRRLRFPVTGAAAARRSTCRTSGT